MITSTRSKTCRYLLVAGLLLSFYTAGAQINYDQISFRIDSLANIGLPKSALKEVDKLDELARKNNNAPQQIRAVIYRMTFQSYLEEDALVAVISRLKMDVARADYPVKPVLQSLLAGVYWNYYNDNLEKFSQRIRLIEPDTDFTKWDIQTVVNETSHLYELSLHDAEREQHTPVGVLDGVLTGDSSTRYLRPTLYDLLVQRAFDFYLTDEPALIQPKLPFSVDDPRFFSDSRTFARLVVTTTDTSSTEYKGIKYLQQATTFHLGRPTKEALADLDLLRIKFLYDRSNAENKDSLYLTALKQIAAHFSGKPISSDALVLQAQYYQGIDSLKLAHDLLTRAATAYPKSLGGKNAAILIKQIEQKDLSATVEDVNVPGMPLLALISYQNVHDASVLVYRLSDVQVKRIADDDYSGNISASDKALKLLKRLSPVQQQRLVLPDPKDYRKHSAEFKINPLTNGTYVMLVKDPLSNIKGLTSFKVTRLAYAVRVNPHGETEIRVLDRETGAPLSGVKVNIYHWVTNSKGETTKSAIAHVLSGNDGKCTFNLKTREYVVSLSSGNDTYTDKERSLYEINEMPPDGTPLESTVLFTDRQLYRPGQTIYFKALKLSTLNGKSSIMPNSPLIVSFDDLNYKVVTSLKLQTNDFGTAQGSFVIPQNVVSGEVYLTGGRGQITLRVEEYKRPTFQVAFLPVTENYRPNDSIKIKGKVTAFSGYGLSRARVAIHITNQGSFRPDRGDVIRFEKIQEVKTDTVTTNDQGEFTVKFKSNAGANTVDGSTINYTVNAEVTDGSGETQSANTNVAVSRNPLKIEAKIPDQILFKGDTIVPVKLSNVNGQQQKGDLVVKIIALKGPDAAYKSRLWNDPDQYILKKKEFKISFPNFAWRNEKNRNTWPQASVVSEINIVATDSTLGRLDLGLLKKQRGGVYKIIIYAKDANGDTTSLTQFVNIVNGAEIPANMDNWLIPVVTRVKVDGAAGFLLGVNKPAKVLMETYDGKRLLTSEWLTLSGGDQRKISIPILAAPQKNFNVQFLMVNDNRVYTYYRNITVTAGDTVKRLKIRFLTFRDKLQPGEKEHWKLQISSPGNEKLPAEMLAGMYDASLDDLSPSLDWPSRFDDNNDGAHYFAWEDEDFVKQQETEAYADDEVFIEPAERDYESLNLFDYSYYGDYNTGYNNYLESVKAATVAAKSDKLIADNYAKNAALIKNGFDMSGRIVDSRTGLGLDSVKISIKNTGIYTLSNSLGYFRIKAPANALLVFSAKWYVSRRLKTRPASALNIVLVDKRYLRHRGLREEQKSMKGANNMTVALDEPVGSADTKVTESDQVKFAPPVVKADMEAKQSRLPPTAARAYSIEGNVGLRGTDTSLFFAKKPMPADVPITIRKNFNETAFFYPQLHTNEQGEIMIDFTIPEALTRWRFRALAHTKDLQTGYIENTVITQKQLSISANTPRFLREGDTITISARLANLTGGKLNGKIQMQLFNALNMQPVSLFVNRDEANQQFEIEGNTNKAISFKLVIPSGLDALTYRLTADARDFSDGEENTIPVLPNRTLVTESMPMMVRAGQTRDFTFDKLVNQSSATLKNKTLTLEYTANPAWYAVQALPYLMEFPYECSEQIFSRYYANSLATNIVNKMPAIKQVIDQWKNSNSDELLSNLEKNQDLKGTLIEETPWLKEAQNETEQKKRIALLFDLNKMSDELKLNLQKLKKRQLPNGGFTWFGGDRADRFITQHILEGIGELYHLGIAGDDPDLQQIADNALQYLDEQLLADDKLFKKEKDYATRPIEDIEAEAWFARSYFLNKPMTADVKKVLSDYLHRASDQWTLRNVYEQGMIALTMQRYKQPDITLQIERSILETARQSDDLGMYWAKNRQGYFWYESPVETQSLLIELFTEAGDNAKAVDEMKIWLLRNKQTNDWKTTKATAAACYALLLKGDDMLADTGRLAIKLDGKPLEELKPDTKADAGTGYIKARWVDEQIKPVLGKVEIKNEGKNISWGAMYWQYLENLDKVSGSETNLQLQRKYFVQKQTDAGPVLTGVDAAHPPKTGDLLKVVVYLKADRDFEYVQLKDMRPAGTEPADALSEYKYQDGLYYYQVSKDVATNFFISYLNKGSYVFEYQLRVAQPGNFSTGITSIQSMYAPEFNAHSQGARMIIKP